MTAEGPGELFEIAARPVEEAPGPMNASLEKCDLGKGRSAEGRLRRLPRHSRTSTGHGPRGAALHCMMTLQGRSRDEAT